MFEVKVEVYIVIDCNPFEVVLSLHDTSITPIYLLNRYYNIT
jgi:hypothetical protein